MDEQSNQTMPSPTHMRSVLDDINLPEKEEIIWEDPNVGVKEYEDYITINGTKLKKPFVEKPVNAEDHEIKIYYSSLNPCGSGYNVLFRKTNNLSG